MNMRYLKVANCIDSLIQKVAIIARWSVLMMLVLGLWNVIGRYLGVLIGRNLSSNALIEGQWYLFDLIFLLGMGWTLQTQNHVRVDVLQSRLQLRDKLRVELFGTLFFLLPFALGLMVVSIEPAFQSWKINEISPDPDGLPRYWIKSLIPLSFFFLSLQGISQAIRNWSALNDQPLRIRHNQEKGKEN